MEKAGYIQKMEKEIRNQNKAKEIKFKEQRFFPFLGMFKLYFPVDENSIFVFEDTIYTNTKPEDLPYDLIAHEKRHMEQQQKIGAKLWIEKYLEDVEFRFKQEIDAYRTQLKAVRKTKDREEYAHILVECANNLSSGLYSEGVSYQAAMKILAKV